LDDSYVGSTVGVYRKILVALAAAALAAGTVACGPLTPPSAQGAKDRPAKSAARSSPATRTHGGTARKPPTRTGALRVLTEPGAGIGAIYRLITGARSSVDLTMYELIDPTAEADLAAAAARGVAVRVLLDQHLEGARNTPTYDYLSGHGVHVRWAPAGTTYHQKTVTVDGATSVIMTLNLVAADYPGTRDFAVIDTDRADITAIVATFDADFAGRGITPPDGTDLVWSPTNAQASVLSVIGGAARTLAVEDEEMNDPAVTSALAAAAKRGVNVRVIMTANSEWDQAFAELSSAGVHIKTYANSSSVLYIHAKAIVADAGRADQRVLVGSQNFSVASLDYNRELGVLSTDPAVVAAIAATLSGDYAGAASYAAAPTQSTGSGPARCTATASVYNRAKRENDVYVHSNQPGQEATATAAGYSHSHRTDGSGYAVIYLDGPPPGAKITVTVGSATCTTSD
jgi:phosphatidylserine/phosphatidylglycerophosphate/cardiolipin synthase-like enzyme